MEEEIFEDNKHKALKRDNVIEWLNKRLVLSNSKRGHVYDEHDITFIMDVIYHYKKERVEINKVIQSIQSIPGQLLNFYMENMTNKLLMDFDIKTETRKVQHPFGNSVFSQFMGFESDSNFEQIIKYY